MTYIAGNIRLKRMGYRKLRNFILGSLRESLSAGLKYHGIHHTLDVLGVCNGYIRRNNIKGKQAELLRVGALMHDYGFLFTYKNHEEKGVEMANILLPQYGYSKEDIQVVSGLIMATKVPQNPQNQMEMILCDCDLDYLGRKDFDPISESLFQELIAHNLLHDRGEWNKIQVKFLESHHYHTPFAQKFRQAVKEKHLQKLRNLIAKS